MIDFRLAVSAAEERRLNEFVSALRAPCEARMNPASLFNSDAFESEFRSKLLTQHCFIGSPLFAQILDVGPKHYAADGPTINIPVGKNPPDFTLKLDRSDAKITVANINKARCLVHGIWQL